jgi:hypothetical protein
VLIEPEMMTFEERRKGFRTTIEMITNPLLGSRNTDWSCFEYDITDISRDGLQIAVGVDERANRLNTNEGISLHAGFGWDRPVFDQGTVIWSTDVTEENVEICGVKAEFGALSPYELWFSTDTCDVQVEDSTYDSGNEFLLSVLDRCVATKDSISRVLSSLSNPASERPKGFRQNAYYWEVRTNQEMQCLKEYSCFIRGRLASNDTVDQTIPPGELKRLLKSDIQHILLREHGIRQGSDPSIERLREHEITIRSSYNTIILLWACYLSYVYKTV